jgi:hypothetical protein
MLQWDTADENADYPLERYRAVSGKHEYRIFYGPEAATQVLPWILKVREVKEEGVRANSPRHAPHRLRCQAGRRRMGEGRPPQRRLVGRWPILYTPRSSPARTSRCCSSARTTRPPAPNRRPSCSALAARTYTATPAQRAALATRSPLARLRWTASPAFVPDRLIASDDHDLPSPPPPGQLQ